MSTWSPFNEAPVLDLFNELIGAKRPRDRIAYSGRRI